MRRLLPRHPAALSGQAHARAAWTAGVRLARRARHIVEADDGQDLVEYALLVALFGLACLAVWDLIASSLGASYASTTTRSQDLWEAPPPGGTPP